jgi:hypothetical protein
MDWLSCWACTAKAQQKLSDTMEKATELDSGSVEVRIDESNMLMNMN